MGEGRQKKGTAKMARHGRIKKDCDAYYHVMSRTNNRSFLFVKGGFKGEIVAILRRAAEFSGVELKAFCLMDDHFHVVCRVTKPDEPVPESEVVRRIGVLKGGRFAAELSEHWSEQRKCGLERAVGASLASWRRRMNDLSEFTKTFKELVSIAYKARCGKPYCGSIWSGRFKSTLIEDGRYLATCIRYVELNPVRARMVSQAKDYAYSSANDEKPNENACHEGPVPEARLLRRIAQVGGGVVLGSYEFVTAAIYGFGGLWKGRPAARRVEGECWSSHGHRLAKEAA